MDQGSARRFQTHVPLLDRARASNAVLANRFNPRALVSEVAEAVAHQLGTIRVVHLPRTR
jgi:hypothetical protein